MSDKNLIAACQTLYDMSSGAEKRQSEPNDLFMVLNQRIHNEINHNYYIQEHGTTEADGSDSGN